MRGILETVAVAFSMFSALPMPQISWEKRNMRYALCAFPLVGGVIGGLCWLWGELCQWGGVPDLLRGAVLCLLPAAVTGGIHLDGYCDTVDALASHGTPARRQEILKDPHIGAFGVIRLCGHFLLSFALWTTLAAPVGKELCLSFCLSRCLSGWAVARFPLAKHSGLAYTFATAADRKRVAWILLLAGVGLGGIVCWKSLAGGAMVLAALLVFWDYWRRSRKYYGGLSGDLAGWFLQRVELWMLAAVWIVEWGAHLL